MDVLDGIIDQNLAVYRHAPSRLQEDVSQEAQVASDYRGRLVYELLQNADDAMSEQSTHDDRVTFLVTDDELWVANTGRTLDDADVQGLCGLGASSKMTAGGRRRASIGHKGLGFKSVLEITLEPAALSERYAFRLGRGVARPLVDGLWAELGRPIPRHVPAMRFPERIEQAPARWETFRSEGFHTAFCFPFHDRFAREHRYELAELLLTLPVTTVLFLKHLENIRVVVDQSARQVTREWLVERKKWTNDEWSNCTGLLDSGLYNVDIVTDDDEDSRSFLVAHDADVEIGDHRGGLSGPAWDGVELSEASIAVLYPGRDQRPVPEEWRRFHVFLPTHEPSTYPMLVNAAFATDLSRQQVRVSPDRHDYNSHLLHRAARLFRDRLLPALQDAGADDTFAVLDRGQMRGGAAASLLHETLSAALADVPLLHTETGHPLTFSNAVVPPLSLKEDGARFREVLRVEATWQGRVFPGSEMCTGLAASVAADHGALPLSLPEALEVLATQADPRRSALYDEPHGRFKLDPVVELCSSLWECAEPNERQAIEQQARRHSLFPTSSQSDGTVRRIMIGDATAFYPPRSTRHDLPLRGLRFMAHEVCWGQLGRRERLTVLSDRMKAWTALFDIKEFRFEEVMRAAVLPGLVRSPADDALTLRDANKNVGALAAICELAGAVTKPDRPLRLNRLGGDRAMFNLGRLQVPCRSAAGSTRWESAYKVYFGRDWIGDDSVEDLVETVGKKGSFVDVAFLAPPEEFLGHLGSITDSYVGTSDDDEEVSLDDDTDEALETDELERWIAFLSWIGVNKCLRLVHFHDVDDDSTGWTKTKDLRQPGGWAFRNLGQTWGRYRENLTNQLGRHPRFAVSDAYLYEVHDLDHIYTLLVAAADDSTAEAAAALFSHFVRHWNLYSPYANAQVALVEQGKWPSARKDPPRATPEELQDAGPNLWLHRLRGWPICPTAHGPRRPPTAWRRSEELERRFGRSGRDASAFLPVVIEPEGFSDSHVRAFYDRVGLRSELTPSTFTLDDARALCERLAHLYQTGLDASRLRTDIKPIYRQLFELLSGRSDEPSFHGQLSDVPLLADTSTGLRFLPARDVVYASVPGTRERSGIAGKVPLFVLEAEPGANAPLASLFDIQVLEDELDWAPQPGEPALTGEDLDAFRNGLWDLLPALLARMSAGRPEARDRDRRTLSRFVEVAEPVESLVLRCSMGGQDLGELPPRRYFVRRSHRGSEMHVFLVWEGGPWPPVAEDAAALAMSLAEALEVNMVETFLAFIQADDQRRLQLLDLAGAASYVDEVAAELTEPATEGHTERPDIDVEPTAAGIPTEATGEEAAPEPVGKAAPARVPLRQFDDLLVDGEPILVIGAHSDGVAPGQGRASDRPRGGTGHASAGTDLGELDRLGMAIAMTYERRRLERQGYTVSLVPNEEPLGDTDALVIDVHTPACIAEAEAQSPTVKDAFDNLAQVGVSRLHPGFDLLSVVAGEPDRLIELKSSGVDAQVQAMSWNEWKSARNSVLRERFWLYLVGNLRADLPNAVPFVRAIRDPFGSLLAETVEDVTARRLVQLRVHEFGVAEELQLGVRAVEAKTADKQRHEPRTAGGQGFEHG